MELINALLREIFDKKQAGGVTMAVKIHMASYTLCSQIVLVSTCGLDETVIDFVPSLPLEEALLQARKYKEKGHFRHT